MKGMLYPKLAFVAMKKNKRLYLPYFLTCIGMVVMHYIVTFLYYDEILLSMRGGRTLRLIMGFGSRVIAIFACIFLFYTNSFLMRRRKKEFGLYNILGMGKRHLGWILFWESFMIGGVSLVAGIFIGIVLSKLAELGMVNIMRESVSYTLFVSPEAVLTGAGVFIGIFLLLFLNALRQVRFSHTMNLLRSDTVGEKPPKANLFLGIMGVLLLAGAYYLAVTIEKPVTAMAYFFIAVIMVIIGTYLLMIAGSVTLCRILQRNKKYYYRPNHFVSVSSMAYRMKRNGAGLASICILATMVLVMISTTSCLYFGTEDSIRAMYPQAFNIVFYMDADVMSDEEFVTDLRDSIAEQVTAAGGTFASTADWRDVQFFGILKQDHISLDNESMDAYDGGQDSQRYRVMFVPLADYNRRTGAEQTLQNGEALLSVTDGSYTAPQVTFDGGVALRVSAGADGFLRAEDLKNETDPVMLVVVPDVDAATEYLEFGTDRGLRYEWHLAFDTGLDRADNLEIEDRLGNVLSRTADDRWTYFGYTIESREESRVNFYSTYGGLFYLGIILSIVFLFAAVLMIYYKQISEGFEDHARFDMMQKIGMTKREIRKSINSQLLTVFFLPLLFAAMHLAFAFPMIRRMLTLFNLNSLFLFAATTAVSFFVFSLLYVLVYRITSNAYYRIVSASLRDAE